MDTVPPLIHWDSSLWAAATSGLQIHSEQSGRGGGEWKGQVGGGQERIEREHMGRSAEGGGFGICSCRR